MDLSLSSSSSSSFSSGSYRECLRNHAASMGGRALDGCGEFMPAHPLSLACAACACHRNFHRRESSSASPPPPPPAPAVASPSPLAFLPLPLPFPPPPPARSQGPSRRKRCRTKFTADQKDRMWIFAEKLGWRIQKHHREELRDFCAEIGVESHALRVWMHNHKNSNILSSSSPGA